jgi:hypothetical protein
MSYVKARGRHMGREERKRGEKKRRRNKQLIMDVAILNPIPSATQQC